MTAGTPARPGGEPLTMEEEKIDKIPLYTLKRRMINVDCDAHSHEVGTLRPIQGGLKVGTVRPDWICMRVISLESSLKGHQPLHVFNFLVLILNIL
jgi:hypothetical protein